MKVMHNSRLVKLSNIYIGIQDQKEDNFILRVFSAMCTLWKEGQSSVIKRELQCLNI